MKINMHILSLGAVFMATSPAFGSPAPGIGTPFKVTGKISRFYGGFKTAESAMWAEAFKACGNLGGGLITNRVSDVSYAKDEASVVSATASFVCVAAGNGD